MYIYELPFDINKELCRILDNDDDWKELAGEYMKYSSFDVNEIDQKAKRLSTSPTNQLFIIWGQLNHRVEELFILLYKMSHIPALRCLVPVVDGRFHRLLNKKDGSMTKDKPCCDLDNNNKMINKVEASDKSIPVPVMLIEKGVHLPTSSNEPIIPTYESSTGTTKNTTNEFKSDLDNEFLKNVSAIPMLSYDELREATDNWNENNLLGRGGFGQVFKGEWKLLPVAVKRLRDNDGENKELIREMCLNQYRHDNILPLYAYSLGGPEACLVYQFMAGGSLEQRLRRKTPHHPLTWSQRHRILHGVARGLLFLHTMAGSPLIHGDIKPANILLDQCTIPKIGDFGLARKGPYGEDRTHLKVSRVHGTRPYLPEEYVRHRRLSPAVDVFSFGVVALETATARHPLPRTSHATYTPLRDLVRAIPREKIAEMEDPILLNTAESNAQLCCEVVSIGVLCTEHSSHDRPTMLAVYKKLDAMDVKGKEHIT